MATDEDGLGLFDTHYGAEASPFKEGDESSVDIYDGLDNSLTVPDNSAPNSTPAGNGLNLFDEILIEEGTAKEASYNELLVEYGKCQQQIKELMKKFKEIQAQNIILQNENQALKKNISALIKTARVEINRKDEEINNLHQRLSEFPNHRGFTRTYLSGSTSGRCSEMCKIKDSKFRSSDLGDSVKMEHRMKNDCSKDAHHNYSSHNTDHGKSSSEKRNTPYLLRYPPEELCNDETHICLPSYDHSSNKDNRKEKKEMKSNEQYSRGNINKYKREVHQSTRNNGDSEDGNSDPQQKPRTLSEKASKNESQQKSQSAKLKCSPSVERRVERGVSSWEKQTTDKDRFQTRGELYVDERSQNVLRKDVKTHDKDEKNTGQKNKPNERLQEQPRRSGRGSSPHSKNEHSKNLHESRKCRMEESRKGKDVDCKRDRGTNDHTSREGRTSPSNSSSREHKYARLKENGSRYEWETAHSKSERHRTEEKRKREREDENRHFRNERKVTKEITHQSLKEPKKGMDVTKSERNKSYKPEDTSRIADSLKDHKVPKTKDDHTGSKSKDLKLSFMEKLNLTLSPAKKQCVSPTGGSKTPSQKATHEGSTELMLQAELLDSAHPVNCGPTEQSNSTLQVLDSAAQSSVEPAVPVPVNSENEALKVATADPAQSEELPTVASSKLSSETLPEAEVVPVQPQALPRAAEVLVPDEMQAETLAEAAEACDLVESEALAAAVAVTDLNHPESLPQEVSGSMAEPENWSVAVGVMQNDNAPPAAEVAQPEAASESKGALPESAAEKKEEDKMCLVADIESSANQCGSQNLVLDNSEAKSSGDLESCHVAEDIGETKTDSLMEAVKDNDHLAAENAECPADGKGICEIDKSISQLLDRAMLTNKGEPLVDQNACDLEPDLTEINTAASSVSEEMYPRTKERETNPVTLDDDSSILSIDLNHLRHIPKAISPLNSPMRPLAKALKMESPCKGLVKSYNKDLILESAVVVCPSKNLSKEVNKENQKPVSMSDEHCEMESQMSISSDEIEEGEIVSSDEEEEKAKPERGSENTKKSRPKASPETRNLTSSPQNQKSKAVCCSEDNGKFVSVKVSTKKNGERHKNQTFRSSKDMKKNKTVSIACLEKIVHVIVEPSNIQEIMQMLRAIRKQMRKSYMKFKVQFPVQHFHRIIESGIINFTSLIKYLNFSKMSTLGETLKFNICDIVESKLKQVKKNAIVDRLFEQQVSDMKKQLWKFVDEQLDYLFEKIRRIIIKLCDVRHLGNESEERKFERVGKQKHKISHKNDMQRSRKKSLKVQSQKPEEYVLSKQNVDYQRAKCHHEKNKTDVPKPAFTKCLNSIDNTRNSQTKVHLSKENNLQGTLTPLKGVKYEKEGLQLSRDANKTDLSYELLTEQQASSLTFNLVSDAQMGEIFKSLLQGSDLLEKNGSNIDRNEWEFRTPEKQFLDGHKCRSNVAELVQEITPKEACVESQPVEDIKWPVVSPVRAPSLTSRLQMSVDPDVLDESCMFEVPTNAVSCKEDECNLQKNKSFVSSILLEDLAVSLTIPSPLKSDSHLSFLKPENNSSSTPEGVLSAHYSEDALLEEEDATEQDIHLALESDNSSSKSSCSSSWTSRPVAPGFQCRPSLPMQAVIMEKSNDHFIVKIRRAVPSVSPASDRVVSVKEVRASSTKIEKLEIRSGEKERDSQSATVAVVQESVKPDLVKMDQLPHVSTGQEQSPALPQLLKESHSSIGKEETTEMLGPCRTSSNTESHDTESTNEGSEQSQALKLKVSENVNESGVRSQGSFPYSCSIESYIDLTGHMVSETSCCVVESTRGNRTQETSTGNLEISVKKEELEECSAFIDLTEDLSNETVAGKCNLETQSAEVGCQISRDDKTSKKRKKEAVRENSNSKRQRKETESAGEGSDASDVKPEEVNSAPKLCSSKKNELQQHKDSSPLASSASSPSLYAKNIIKKKGEVVVSWTRNDDREILLECQRKGPSSKTFVSLATRLNKSPNQVSERFKQLMKLFKKSKCK